MDMSSFLEISSTTGTLFGYDPFETSPPLVKVVMVAALSNLILVDVGGVLQFSRWSEFWMVLSRTKNVTLFQVTYFKYFKAGRFSRSSSA